MEPRLASSTILAGAGIQLVGLLLAAVLWTFVAPVGTSSTVPGTVLLETLPETS